MSEETTVLIFPRYAGSRVFTRQNPLMRDIELFVDALRKEYKVILPYPSNKEKRFFEGHQRLDSVEYVPLYMPFPEFVDDIILTEEMYHKFNQYNGEYQYDIVFNMHSVNSLLIQRVLTAPRWLPMSHSIVPVPVVQTPYSGVRVKEGWKYGGGCLKIDSDVEVLTYLNGDRYLFHSPSDMHLVRDQLLKVANPNAVRRFLDDSTWLGGIDIDELLQNLKENSSDEKDIDILYAGRLSTSKNASTAARAMNHLAVTKGLKCVINTHTSGRTVDGDFIRDNYPAVQMDINQPYHEYLAKLSRSKIFMLLSSSESFCYTMFEAFLAGCVVILMDTSWNRELLPIDYPYRISSAEEGVIMVDEILSDHKTALMHVEAVKNYIEKTFNIPVFERKLLEYTRHLMKQRYLNLLHRGGGIVEVMKNVFDSSDSLLEFESKIRENANSPNVFISRAKLRTVYKCLRGDFHY